ncbi:hypothetical protein LX64_02563 [Chitinophaga skermanii]|uniref:Uncharacterized protein n=1 Tax=Chitinophaga skermanii TaxID=331697 RepID=A0A327QNE2_9BACT|nr:hypothetical protein [Chitinophaga skermanii]RAJ05405.1 hypothetical protein LX64_02563 [Chitinophaga skermanii]
MSKNNDDLKKILQAHGAEVPSNGFAERLSANIIASREAQLRTGPPVNWKLGKITLWVLMGLNIVVLCQLGWSYLPPVVFGTILISLAAVAAVVWMMKKVVNVMEE